MVAMDDKVPLARREEGNEDNHRMNRGDDGEITIELYQHHHNKDGGNQSQNMGLGSDDISAWDWFFKCFGCKRRSGSNFERIHLGEKQECVVNMMADSRGGGREPNSRRNSFSEKQDSK